MALADYLRKTREAKGLSQRQLSMLSGVSNSEISRIEAGSRKGTSPEVLRALANPLGVSYEDLMVEAGYLAPGIRHDDVVADSESRGGDPERATEIWPYEIPQDIREFLRDEAGRGWPYLKMARRFSQEELKPSELEALVHTWLAARRRYEEENPHAK